MMCDFQGSKAHAQQDSVAMFRRHRRGMFVSYTLAIIGFCLATSGGGWPNAWAQDPAVQRCFAIELYVKDDAPTADQCIDSVRAVIAENRGTRLKVHRLSAVTDDGKAAGERLKRLADAFKLEPVTLPLLYGMNHVLTVPAGSETDQTAWAENLATMLKVEIFTRPGCSKCDNLKAYLAKFRAKYPALKIELLDVIANPRANARYTVLARQQGIGGVSFPGVSLCRQLMVGFDSEATGATRLDAILNRWSFDCVLPQRVDWSPRGASGQVTLVKFQPPNSGDRVGDLSQSQSGDSSLALQQTTIDDAMPEVEIDDFDLPIDLPVGPNFDFPDGSLSIDSEDAPTPSSSEIDIPWIGRVSAERLGLPLFTLVIGLVDGFNPCAMWVLLFLLSVLVNLKDRWKILAVAGTFVFISGAAYFAFMAAWLNVLLLVGFLRSVQITLAILAIAVGAIHVKDFFAFKKGVSLSIPESAKPGIYARVRKIVMAENLFAAIAGASVLAVLVNIIELLCTAGLPALYSQILMMQDFPTWKNYAYLGLYVIAYMFDDAIMVSIVVATLGKRKLQEHEGRWLKLISGLVILLLGLVLLLRPQWIGG
jgi:hypothetical protein